MKLSVIIPAYNEKETIEPIIERVLNVKLESVSHEIVVVDDGSTDGTVDILKRLETKQNASDLRVFFHSKNLGKGAAIRTALDHVLGDIVIIQDADLEYQPEEYPVMLEPFLRYGADAVYGTRFLGIHRAFMFWHYLGNKVLTLLTNVLYDSMISDMEVGYKAFRTEIIRNLHLNAKGFDFEPEITAKVLKRRIKLYEVPISYSGRDYHEGKKITWKDGVIAIWTLFKYRFKD